MRGWTRQFTTCAVIKRKIVHPDAVPVIALKPAVWGRIPRQAVARITGHGAAFAHCPAEETVQLGIGGRCQRRTLLDCESRIEHQQNTI